MSAEEEAPAEGRVLRLHFACRAALPHGSTLRVTSTRLWAPDSSSAHITEGEAPQGSEDSTDFDHHGADADKHLYASSVEMVTTPETYPVWRTRTPVVVVANAAGGDVQKHRYRYMVVTPGVNIEGLGDDDLGEEAEEMVTAEAAPTDSPDHAARLGGGAHTTDETGDGPLSVMMWEDPFVDSRDPSVSFKYLGFVNIGGFLPWFQCLQKM